MNSKRSEELQGIISLSYKYFLYLQYCLMRLQFQNVLKVLRQTLMAWHLRLIQVVKSLSMLWWVCTSTFPGTGTWSFLLITQFDYVTVLWLLTNHSALSTFQIIAFFKGKMNLVELNQCAGSCSTNSAWEAIIWNCLVYSWININFRFKPWTRRFN